MARLGPSGLAQLFREIANYVSTRLSNYSTKDELDSILATKADDDNVIHTSDNETINGTKTFTSGPWVTNNQTSMGFSIKNTAIARNDIPTEYHHHAFRAYDKNSKILGEYCVEKSTSGEVLLNMGVRSEDDSGTQINYGLGFRMTNDGSLVRFFPSANNKVHLGDPGAKWLKVHSDDVVHTSGNETIAGTKTFSNSIISNKDLHYKDTTYDWSNTSLNTWCDAGHVAWYDKTGNRRMHELVGAQNGVWRKACYINENQYFSVDSNRNISYWGTATFNGHTIFTQDMIFKNNNIDLTVTPTNTLYSNFIFTDKNDQNVAYVQYAKRNTDPDILGLYINDKDKNLHGIQITSNNYLLPMGNNIWNLGSPNNVWTGAYINRITCANIVRPVENSYIYMTAGPDYNSGASIFLNGKSGDGMSTGKGTFLLFARDGTNERRLLGYPTGILSWNGCIEAQGMRSTTGNAFMAQYGSYTFLIRNDGSNTYFLMSDKDGTPGTWSTARPLTINDATGTCNINGNANSATYSTTQAASDNSTKIATTAYVKSQGYVNLTSLAGGNSAGSLSHSVGSLVLARCASTAFANTKSYANVAGQQLYPCRTEIYTMFSSPLFTPMVIRGSDWSLGSGTWRYLGGANANFNNAAGEVFGMFLRVA